MRHSGLFALSGLLPWVLGGCASLNAAAGTVAGLDAVVSVPVFKRSMTDMMYSGITGRDCSIVRLEQGKTYCVPREGEPEPPEFCTRSLGVVDCWANPAALPGRPVPVADQPALTPQQEANRTARWPNL
jgi:hypothetical protein